MQVRGVYLAVIQKLKLFDIDIYVCIQNILILILSYLARINTRNGVALVVVFKEKNAVNVSI